MTGSPLSVERMRYLSLINQIASDNLKGTEATIGSRCTTTLSPSKQTAELTVFLHLDICPLQIVLAL